MHQGQHRGGQPVDVDRRRFLRRAAVVGTAVWTVPTIVSVDVASAQQLTSPLPTPPGGVGEVTVEPVASQVAPAARTTLPRTGVELDDLARAGLMATAGGAALVLWSAQLES